MLPNVELKHRCSIFLTSIFWQTCLVHVGECLCLAWVQPGKGREVWIGMSLKPNTSVSVSFSTVMKCLSKSTQERRFTLAQTFRGFSSESPGHISAGWDWPSISQWKGTSWWLGIIEQGAVNCRLRIFPFAAFLLARPRELSNPQVQGRFSSLLPKSWQTFSRCGDVITDT